MLCVLLYFMVGCEKMSLSHNSSEESSVVSDVGERALVIPVLDRESVSFLGQNAYCHVKAIVEMGSRSVGSSGLAQSVNYIEAELRRAGWDVERQVFLAETVQGKKTMTNVRARLAGSPGGGADFSTAPRGVFSGHIDAKEMAHPFQAANDGGSHTGVLLEFARVLGRQRSLGKGIELVFFDGEESFSPSMDGVTDGLYGSRHYVSVLRQSLPQWMVNVDMVGVSPLRIRVPADTEMGIYACYARTVRETKASSHIFGVSEGAILDDHLPFQDAGVPALNLIGDFQNTGWWHTPYDTLEIISPTSLETTGNFLLSLLERLP